MADATKGGFVFMDHKIDEPIPPAMLAKLPEYIRPYAERARLEILKEEKVHREEHGHSFDGHPACLAGSVSMFLRDLLKSGKLPDEQALQVATAMFALGSVIAFVVEMQTALSVGKELEKLLGSPIQAADIPGKPVDGPPDIIPFRGPKKGTS